MGGVGRTAGSMEEAAAGLSNMFRQVILESPDECLWWRRDRPHGLTADKSRAGHCGRGYLTLGHMATSGFRMYVVRCLPMRQDLDTSPSTS